MLTFFPLDPSMLPIGYVHPGRMWLLPHLCQGLRRELWWTFPGFAFAPCKEHHLLLFRTPINDAFHYIVIFQTAGTCARDLRCLRQCECKTNTKKNCVFPFSYEVTYLKQKKIGTCFWWLQLSSSKAKTIYLIKMYLYLNREWPTTSAPTLDPKMVPPGAQLRWSHQLSL